MTKTTNKIAIITTRQNYKWISMQEVLPAIEQCWEETARAIGAEARVLNIDEVPMRNFIQFLFQCDVIVIIAFNETISRFMREVRLSLNLPVPFILHLYGHASLGLWPQQRFGVLPIMHTGDAFVGTCPGDVNCMKITGKNLSVFDIPYPFFPIEMNESKRNDNGLCFAYIGRISDQKNIDVLIDAYHLLSLEKADLPPLFLYGKEDHFGSPNMGIPSTDCQKNLEAKIQDLKLVDKIFFQGFKKREELYAELGRNHIFLSASTHSDENFGMALMRSLSLGSTAVVSHWGGHIPFQRQTPERVWTVPVEFKSSRPKPDSKKFSAQMKIALEKSSLLFEKEIASPLPDYFLPAHVVEEFKKVLEQVSPEGDPLEISETAHSMYQQQLDYEASGDMQRVFTSYEDPKAQLFLRAYAED